MTNFAKQQMLRMRTRGMFPFLIEISHSEFGTYRFINADDSVVFEGNTYEAASFTITPPKREGSSVGNATLTLSAVDQQWIVKIRGTRKRANIRFIAAFVYSENDSISIESLEDLEFVLTEANWDDNGTITWKMVFDDTMQVMVPCDIATFTKVPGIA